LSITMEDGKPMSLMILFQSMKRAENQFGVWISNNHGNLFFLNFGLKEIMFFARIITTIHQAREDTLGLKTQLHLSLLTVSQTATGNSST